VRRSPRPTPPPRADVWAWQERAACRDVDPDLFFAPEEERGMRRRAREVVAVALCGTCPRTSETIPVITRMTARIHSRVTMLSFPL